MEDVARAAGPVHVRTNNVDVLAIAHHHGKRLAAGRVAHNSSAKSVRELRGLASLAGLGEARDRELPSRTTPARQGPTQGGVLEACPAEVP
jgi:hypothetical protein